MLRCTRVLLPFLLLAASASAQVYGTATLNVTGQQGTALTSACTGYNYWSWNTPFTSWTLTPNPALPAGLSLQRCAEFFDFVFLEWYAGYRVVGTPTVSGTGSSTVTISGGTGPSATLTVNWNLSPSVNFSPTTISALTVGRPVNIQFTGSNGTSPYSFSHTGNLPAGLTLNSSGLLSGTPTTAASYSFNVTVTDGQSNTASNGFNVTVNAAPTLPGTTSYFHTAGNTRNISLAATGGTAPLTYTPGSLPSGASFSAGQLSINTTVASSFNFSLQVSDANGATASQTYSVTVSPALTISDQTLPQGVVGQPYSATLAATGGRAPLSWSTSAITLSNYGLTYNSSSGAISGTPTDRTFMPESITVTVTDANGISATALATFSIINNIVISPSTLPAATQGTPYSAVISASGSASASYSFTGTLPAGLSLQSHSSLTSRTVSGTPNATGTFNFSVTATDTFSQSGSTNLSLTINPAPAISGSGQIAASAPNTPVSRQFTATGGTAPLTWSATGNFVTGTSFNSSNATYSGTPTTSGTSSFTVTVTDANGATATLAVTHNIYNTLQISHALPAQLTQTQSVNASFTATGGAPNKTYSLDSGSLPPGLTLNTSTGTLTGAPTASGSYAATIRVTDSLSSTATTTWSVLVYPVPALGPLSLQSAPGQSANVSLPASGGASPYQFSLSAGSLPPGVTLSSGTLTGAPNASGTYNFTIQIQDQNGVTASSAYSWLVVPALTLNAPTLPGNTSVGAPWNFSFSTTGGQAPITLSLQGALPPGLSFDAAQGLLSGSPTQTGAFIFSIRAQDSLQQIASRSFTLNVGNKPGISGTLAPATAGAPYSSSLSIVAPNNLESATPTSPLPPGLSFSYSGLTATLSGTPTTPGQYLVDIEVQDKAGEIVSGVFPLDVRPALSIPSGQVLPALSSGQSFIWAPQSQGGTPPVRWALSQGTLPQGLSLDASTGRLAGTPTASGEFPFTLSATDRNGSSATLALTASVALGLRWSSSMWTAPQSSKDQPLSLPLLVEGGTPPYTFRVQAGNLPAGLALEDAFLRGAPTSTGLFRFTLLAIDSANRSAQWDASLLVAAGLSVQPARLSFQSRNDSARLTILAEPVGAQIRLLNSVPGLRLSADTAQVPAVITVSLDPAQTPAPFQTELEIQIPQSNERVRVPVSFAPPASSSDSFLSSVTSAPGHAFALLVHTRSAASNFTLRLEGPGAAAYRLQPASGTASSEQPFHASIDPLTPAGAAGLEATLVVRHDASGVEIQHPLVGLPPATIRLSTNRLALLPGASFLASTDGAEAAYATIRRGDFFTVDAPTGTLNPSRRLHLLSAANANPDANQPGFLDFYTADGRLANTLEVYRPNTNAMPALWVDSATVAFPALLPNAPAPTQFTLSNPGATPVDFTLHRPLGLNPMPFSISPESGTVAPGATQSITLQLAPGLNSSSAFEVPLVLLAGNSQPQSILVRKSAAPSSCEQSGDVQILPLTPYPGQPLRAGTDLTLRFAVQDACGQPVHRGKLTVALQSGTTLPQPLLLLPSFASTWETSASISSGSAQWVIDVAWTDGTRTVQRRLSGPALP